MNAAVGMIEVQGVAGIVCAADAVLKSARVELAGWESIGGYTTLFLRGDVSSVEAALRSGEQAAREAIDHVICARLARADPCWHEFVATPLRQTDPPAVGALGLIEARGYGRHLPRNDALVKAAHVEVWNVLTVMSRVVCTLVVGNVGDVREAVRVARDAVEDEHLVGATVLSRPRPEVLRAFAPAGEAA